MASKGKAVRGDKLSRKAEGLLLDTFELTDSASRNVLIATVKQMFDKGTIRTLAAAEQLIKQIQDEEMDKVDAAFARLDKSANKKSAKHQASEMAREFDFTEQQRETSKHVIRIKNKRSELPTFELRFKKVHTTFEAAWKDGLTRNSNKEIEGEEKIEDSCGG